MHILSCFIISITTELNIALTMTFFSGIGMAGRLFVGYVWMTEHMPVSSVPKATAAMFFIDSSNLIWVSIYF